MNRLAARSDQRGSTAVLAVAIVLVGALLGFTAWRVHETHKKTTTAGTSTNTSGASPAASSSLQRGLNNVNDSLNQENQDDAAAGSALNDQQNQVQIPTN